MTARTVFLLDGIGALLSFIVTGLILPHFSDVLGLPKDVLYFLAAFPVVYMIFSLSCYRFAKVIQAWMLLVIILANLVYTLVSASILLFLDGLQPLGRGLLAAEILILLAIVALERRVYQGER